MTRGGVEKTMEVGQNCRELTVKTLSAGEQIFLATGDSEVTGGADYFTHAKLIKRPLELQTLKNAGWMVKESCSSGCGNFYPQKRSLRDKKRCFPRWRKDHTRTKFSDVKCGLDAEVYF